MVERSLGELNSTFRALADPTRRSLLSHLVEGEASVTELAEPYDVSLAAISKHIQILERAGLIRRRVEGRSHYLSLEASPMLEALTWLAGYREFWDTSLTALGDLFQGES